MDVDVRFIGAFSFGAEHPPPSPEMKPLVVTLNSKAVIVAGCGLAVLPSVWWGIWGGGRSGLFGGEPQSTFSLGTHPLSPVLCRAISITPPPTSPLRN